MTSASEAILVARAMQLPVFLRAAKLAYAVAAHRGEHLIEAHVHYQQVAAQAPLGSRQHLYAQMNSALLHLRHGEDHRARNELSQLAEDHTAAALESSLQYARAVSALVPEDEPIMSCPSGNYDGIVRALQLLSADQDQPTPDKLQLLLDGLSHWEPRSSSLQPMVAWLQGSALLRLGQPLLAAARVGTSRSALPDISAMLLCLKIELALHIHGCDIALLPTLCAELKGVFDHLPHREARYGMAQRLVLWHPLASAYVACSPVSIPALVDAASPVIFRDGRPIQVHGRVAPTRLPFVQMTLAAFDIHSSLPRDQSAERERMAQAFLVCHGNGKRWLPIIPPAQIAYHLCRASETHGVTWHHAAQEVARVYGLVPRTLGAFLRDERKVLHKALNDLLHRQVTMSQFRNTLASLAPGD
ncbi:hypothetical protein DESA109040_07435 [Deinococcus saxicola]